MHVQTATSRLWTLDSWLAREEADRLFHHVQSEVPLDKHPSFFVHGKELHMRRSLGFFSDALVHGYKFSGQETLTRPLTPLLRDLLEKVNETLGTAFNAMLINLYADGSETIGAHSDSATGLAADGSVAALSLGAARIFRVRSKPGTVECRVDILTQHGQLLMMERAFQAEFTHEVPVQKKVTLPRVSITFRQHKEM